ncbi:MAG: TrmH family RNA methyltransferase [Collinsella sp.]
MLDKVADAHPELKIPVFVGAMDLLEQLTGFSVTRGALAAFRRPPLADPVLSSTGSSRRADARPVRVCVLEGIVDHSNVGAIFRSAAALNVDGILVSPTCVDPLYRRSARVSMGTVFQVPWTHIGSEARVWPYDGFEVLKGAGFTCSAMALSDDSVSLDDPSLLDIERHAIFMGTEGAGLQAKTIAGCDKTIRIPMAHGVDSLNVAAAECRGVLAALPPCRQRLSPTVRACLPRSTSAPFISCFNAALSGDCDLPIIGEGLRSHVIAVGSYGCS